ncbi:putative feruloyl esterase B-1 [Colletotrichum sp. SAR 10_70]|nr:putative feruloyl esterase B-1 [Colletotrichum sp. SAR 10_70]KAI8168162.1 putative feruloyl esterase B-1 [Colletotrichum sp. SAR 10_71]
MKPYLAVILSVLAMPALAFSPNCTATTFAFPDTRLISASLHPANTTLLIPQVPSCGGALYNLTTPASICRVVLDVATSPSSAVRVEGWLPPPEAWNSRLLASGTGGIGGCVDYPDFWRGAVYNDTTWTPHAFNESLMDFAVALNPGGINSDFRNLTAFRARGGKILQYHGRADQTVTPALSSEFFEGVKRVVGLTQAEMDGVLLVSV